MRKKIIFAFLALFLFSSAFIRAALGDAADKMQGKIIISVEEQGQAWYVLPDTKQRVFLGRPSDAYQVMREFGLGVSNANFNRLVKNKKEASRFSGKILLKVEDYGKAYYVNPQDKNLYYLGTPLDAFSLMKKFGVGIKKADLETIPVKGEKDNGNDSPFGMHPAHTSGDRYVEAVDMGVKWHRPSLYAFWTEIQKDLNVQKYDFSRYDRYYGSVPVGISILANIAPDNPKMDSGYTKNNSFLPVDEKKYVNFVKAVIERYDGDGKNDMPGLKNPIMYWQVGNEPLLKKGEDFAKLQIMTYSAIKESCPQCKVMIGGVPQQVHESDRSFISDEEEYFDKFKTDYEPYLSELNGKGFDVFDFHWYGGAGGDYRKIGPVFEELKVLLKKYGFENTPVWVTEMGAYSGTPVSNKRQGTSMPHQTECQQAADYLKRFVYPVSIGIKKIFPAFGLKEGFVNDDGYFDHTGFIYDGKGSNDLGVGVKKLSYYTYKKMTEILEGSNWNNIKTVQEKDGVYVYKFTKKDKSIWVAWNDNNSEKTVEISGISSAQLKITEAVPKYASGKEVSDYNSAFSVEERTVKGGKTSLTLKDKPVFIEEK